MSKSIRHDPRKRMSKVDADRVSSAQSPIVTMSPDELERWIRANPNNLQALRNVVVELAKVVNALANQKR